MPSPERLGARQFLARRRLPLPTCSGDKLPGAIGSSDIIYTAPLPGLLDFSFRLNESGVIVNTFDKIHSVVHYHTIDCWNISTNKQNRKKKKKREKDTIEKGKKKTPNCLLAVPCPFGSLPVCPRHLVKLTITDCAIHSSKSRLSCFFHSKQVRSIEPW